eukprot:GHVR01083075.1.p1 GENE.GHVR01083075.1~~GHVR01083075.1.p1  ORF type:complete len:283 (+),score=71.26 GHVR01083075.1:45-893(+)
MFRSTGEEVKKKKKKIEMLGVRSWLPLMKQTLCRKLLSPSDNTHTHIQQTHTHTREHQVEHTEKQVQHSGYSTLCVRNLPSVSERRGALMLRQWRQEKFITVIIIKSVMTVWARMLGVQLLLRLTRRVLIHRGLIRSANRARGRVACRHHCRAFVCAAILVGRLAGARRRHQCADLLIVWLEEFRNFLTIKELRRSALVLIAVLKIQRAYRNLRGHWRTHHASFVSLLRYIEESHSAYRPTETVNTHSTTKTTTKTHTTNKEDTHTEGGTEKGDTQMVSHSL